MIVIDIETTGLNPNTCSILSVGALEFSAFPIPFSR